MKRALISLIIAGSALPVLAQESSASVDLVGRNGAFTVTTKSGVETVDQSSLQLDNKLAPSAPRQDSRMTSEAPPRETNPNTSKTKAAKSAKPASSLQKPVVKETEEQKAIRAADVEDLRQMRNQGGAYFYDESNKPIPFDEVDRRIATGEVEGMKVVGLHLQEWTPQTKSAVNPAGNEQQPEPAPVPVKEKREY